MKATGEVMAIDRTFEGALNKAIRSLELNVYSLTNAVHQSWDTDTLFEMLEKANDQRLFVIAEAMKRDVSLEKIQQLTQIDPWFLHKISSIVELEKELSTYTWDDVPTSLLKTAKRNNISDKLLAKIYLVPEKQIRSKWKQLNWQPGYKMVDTCSAEFDAITPYYYSTWHGFDEVEVTDGRKILSYWLWSDPNRSGS